MTKATPNGAAEEAEYERVRALLEEARAGHLAKAAGVEEQLAKLEMGRFKATNGRLRPSQMSVAEKCRLVGSSEDGLADFLGLVRSEADERRRQRR